MIDSCLGERQATDSKVTVSKSAEVFPCSLEVSLAVYIYSLSFIMSGGVLNILLASRFLNCRFFSSGSVEIHIR